ncbi:DNRLRE domain-containing protein [Blastococcus sp. TBT05-19]|uniref:DNRLRE domain-containing protein n=1 Tax=Blastococcus sp. TBT05-19 TaxID=2250581 RepID=UPI0011BF7295|nr:DNRLRE domain-containing protein [Blastococcus sp. TBT05-19]
MTIPGGSVAFQGIGRLPKPRLEGSRATYENVKPGVDLVIEVNREGFEQFWVLRDRPGRGRTPRQLDLSLELVTDGLDTVVRDGGHVDVVDTAGATVATLPMPTMWDAVVDATLARPIAAPASPLSGMGAGEPPSVPKAAKNQRRPHRPSEQPYIAAQAQPATPPVLTNLPSSSLPPLPEPAVDGPTVSDVVSTGGGAAPEVRPVDTRTEKMGPGRTRMTFEPDTRFLDAQSTRYPVVIDPQTRAGTHFSTYVQSNVFNTDHSGLSELKIGTYNDGATVARSFLTMDMRELRDKTILSSRLALWSVHSWSCVARDWEVWWTGRSGVETRWGNQPGWHRWLSTSPETRGHGGSCGDGWVYAELTDGTQLLADRNDDWWDLGLKAKAENDNYGWKVFDSKYAPNPPRLDVDFRDRPDPARDLEITNSGTDSAVDGSAARARR